MIKQRGKNDEKTLKKSIQKKGRKTGCPPTTGPGARSLPLGPGGHTNQQDRIQSIRGKTKIISLGEILKGEVLKGEVLKDKPQQKLTRPGRLRARSGSKLPEANVPLRALEEALQERMYFLLGCVRHSSGKYDLID